MFYADVGQPIPQSFLKSYAFGESNVHLIR